MHAGRNVPGHPPIDVDFAWLGPPRMHVAGTVGAFPPAHLCRRSKFAPLDTNVSGTVRWLRNIE